MTWLISSINKWLEKLMCGDKNFPLPPLMDQVKTQYPLQVLDHQGDSYQVQLATYSDLFKFESLQAKAYQGYQPWSRMDFQAEWKANPYAYYLLLCRDEEIIGLASGRIRYKESHLSHLLVLPDYQGRGLGRILCKAWLDRGDQLQSQRIILEVRESNLGAQGLYESLGFQQIGSKTGYYLDNHETAIVMERKYKGGE